MSSLNKVILIGNLGKDPELRFTQSQQPVCGFTVATSDQWTDKSGSKQEATEWHNVTVWGKQGENCNKYLKKGSKVYVEGSIKTDSYEKDGTKVYTTKIVAREIKFLTPKSESGAVNLPPNNREPEPPKREPQSLEDIPF